MAQSIFYGYTAAVCMNFHRVNTPGIMLAMCKRCSFWAASPREDALKIAEEAHDKTRHNPPAPAHSERPPVTAVPDRE